MMGNSYKTAMERDLDSIGTYHVSGTSRAMMSNRISYFFDWRGPSMYVYCKSFHDAESSVSTLGLMFPTISDPTIVQDNRYCV